MAFYSAEKGRDLVHTHAWRDGLKKAANLMDLIELEYEFSREQNALFNDDMKKEGEE